MDNYSDDNSYDSETEVLMYAQLYFEPNKDYIPLPTTSATEIFCKQINYAQESLKSEKNVSNKNINNIKNEFGNDLLLTKNKPQSSFVLNNFSNINEIPSSSNTFPPNKLETSSTIKQAIKSARMTTNTVNRADITAAAPRRRQRLLSNSSVQSLSGSVELDSLYCLDDDLFQDDGNRLNIGDHSLPTITEEPIQINRRNQNENIIGKQQIRKRKFARSNSNVAEACGNHESIPNIVVIDSDFDTDESKIPKSILTDDPNPIRNFLTRLKTNSSDVVKTPPKATKVIKKNKKRKLDTSFNHFVMDVSGESGTESVDADASLITNLSWTKNTCLTTPIASVYGTDTSLTTVADTSRRKRRRRNHWPLDYTSGRESSATRSPALPHWTPHMVAFYDSDVSEEFNLEQFHKKMPCKCLHYIFLINQ